MSVRGYRLASRATALLGGDRRSSLSGSGGEFMDYRAYEPGDEPRHVDWNVYARTGRLFTRQYHAERSSRVYGVLDQSASMLEKQQFSQEVLRFLRTFARADTWLDRQLDGLGAGLSRLALERPGLLLLVTDGLEPLPAVRTGLASLVARDFDVSVIQTLSPDDLEPPIGPWRVRDAEDGLEREVDDAARRVYLSKLARHLESFAALTRGLGLRHTQLRSDTKRAELWSRLRRAGILERGT
jgi:uncharacterized protein (DUF58 family)